MKAHILECEDIYLNLAFEQKLFMEMQRGERQLIVWKNKPAVVMGRFQNPWLECNLGDMKNQGIVLARRQSGGGTVYHDLGNLNISFMDWKENYSKENNNEVLINTLSSFDYEAITSGRSDIQIITPDGNRKVSGAAFKQKKDRAFHHCTMLLNSNLDELNLFLKPKLDHTQVNSKAIASVRSKVANIEISESDFIEALIKSWDKDSEVKRWSINEIQEEIQNDLQYFEHLTSWKWIFGETPLFETQLVGDGWRVQIAVKKGIIKHLELEHSIAHPSFCEEIIELLTDKRLLSEDIENALNDIVAGELYQKETTALVNLLNENFCLDFN